MTYTRSWNESTPTDSDAASTIDDLLRNLEVDIRERLDDVVADFTADPVVPIGPGTHRVRATKTSPQSIPDDAGSLTLLTWDEETYDVGDLHDKITDNPRITIPTGGQGLWMFGTAIAWDSSSVGRRLVRLVKNGGSGVWQDVIGSAPDAITMQAVAFPPEVVVATDFYDIRGRQNSGGSLNITNDRSSFWGMRVA